MARVCALLVMLVVLEAMTPRRGLAQEQAAQPALSGSATEVLPGLPRPPDAPASLLKEPSATLPYTCAPLLGPYFERDPLLDPPVLQSPGWFTGIDIGIVGPHVKNRLRDLVQVGGGMPDTVHLPSADLDWTVAPRVEIGYRLPSGFGEFAVAYRFLTSDGTGTAPGADAPSTLKSRLAVNVGDLDYASREFQTFQWPHANMKWRFGLRVADVFFDSEAVEPFAAAAAGSGILETHVRNHFTGFGPHAGLELTRLCESWGVSFVTQADAATLLGRTRQKFTENSTALDVAGAPLSGETRRSNPQTVPMINVFVGLRWQPHAYANVHIDCGYQYEYWWNVGRLSTSNSRSELSDQGVLLRAEWNF